MGVLSRICILFSLLAGVVSCSHYQLGKPGSVHQVSEIWIEPVAMMDTVQGVAVPLNRELREAVIRGNQFKLASSKENADFLLRVRIVERKRESLARRSDDTGLSDVLKYDLIAEYDLLDSSGNTVRKGNAQANGQVFRSFGFNESTRVRLPALIRDLADDILQDCVLNW